MFNDRYGLTQAVIEGRKIMTRREIKAPRRFRGQDVNGFWVYRRPDTREVVEVCMKDYDDFAIEGGQIFPKYKLGEVVAVAQRYSTIAAGHPDVDTFLLHVAKAHKISLESVQDLAGWNNKMFTKAELVPHRIRITGIRCERLQDISDAECLKEGVVEVLDAFGKPSGYYTGLEGTTLSAVRMYCNTPREAFAALIDKVSGRGTWKSNPWVMVYEFELVK